MSNPDLTLSPNQTNLLRAALVSNQPTDKTTQAYQTKQNQDSSPVSMSDNTAPGSGPLDFSDDSPFLDFGIDGELDDSFDFDAQGQMIGDLEDDDNSGSGLHDKRKASDAQEDDDEGGGKRREGDDKAAKKPGRKPLTEQPTTKRKAQNRAAQRAFRERKEKHLKDLETKVEDLEKASESVNHENGLLKAQVERLSIELREYRKRLAWMTNNPVRQQQSPQQQNRNSIGANDFQFEFPKFGDLPAANFKSPDNSQSAQQRTNSTPSANPNFSASPVSAVVPRHSSVGSGVGSNGNSPMNNTYSASPSAQSYQGKNSVDSLSGLFSPSILEATRNNSLSYFPDSKAAKNNPTGRQSFDTYPGVPGLVSGSSTNTDSPGSTSDAQNHISSMGTSPEPLFNSPNNKQDFGLHAVTGDKQLNTFDSQNFTADLNATGFDWLAQQNGGGFDPVLFGDYRETQDNILSQDFGSFFNDAYPLPELGSPMHNYGDVTAQPTDPLPKSDLMKHMDAVTNGEEVVPGEKSKMLTCNKIWDRLQSMEKFRNGEIDIDNLCSELRAKAKCSEGGAVVDEKHVNKLLGL